MRTWLVLVLCGCGLGPAPDPATDTTGAGTSPWSDLGGAQVCLGDQALGPPGDAPGGLCVSSDAPIATPCLADTDCRDRELCTCGRCAIAFCAASSDCPAPRICTFSQHRCDLPCALSSECGDVEDCIADVCRGRCAVTSECQHGERCDSHHTCVTDDCADDAACQPGERCEVQRAPMQVLEPAPVARAGQIILYLDLAAPNLPDERAIWRAVSSDGVHFTIEPSHAVLDDPLSVRAPSVVIDGDTTFLYFEHGDGTELRVATSPDGITFGTATTVLVGPDVHAPAALHAGGGVILYYERGGSIGLATGAPQSRLDDRGIVLRPADVDVGVDTPGAAFWLGINRLVSPQAILAGPDGAATIHLWFSGFGQESSPAMKFGQSTPIPPNFSIGFAAADPTAPDVLSVWPYGPVVDRVEVFLDHRDELAPAGVDAGDDHFLLYYLDATHDPRTPSVFTLGRLGVLGSGAAE
jgi:hypothetical protein